MSRVVVANHLCVRRVAVDTFWDEIEDRLMSRAPSRSRMVQMYMSKQMKITDAIPQEWSETAKGYYLKALRTAHETIKKKEHHKSVRLSPRKHPSSQARRHGIKQLVSLFATSTTNDAPAMAAAPADSVTREAAQWAAMAQTTIEGYRNPETKLIDEFKLVFDLKKQFPLHHHVFKQTSSHRGTEAKCEQVFSIAKWFSDPNMLPDFLRLIVMMHTNKSKYKPTCQQVWELYQSKHRRERNYEIESDTESELDCSNSQSDGDTNSDSGNE